MSICSGPFLSNENTETVKILFPLTDNPNAPDNNGQTPIYWAAFNGQTEIVKILAPLTDNPNAHDNTGQTPILNAALNGHTEIVKILAPLTDNPNAPDHNGETPIMVARNEEIRKILKSFINSKKRKARPLSRPSKEKKF